MIYFFFSKYIIFEKMNKDDEQCLLLMFWLACGDGIGMECLTLSNEEFFFFLSNAFCT